jgi:hypothetical protein
MYQQNKSPLNFSNRDFVDKQVKFRHEECVYLFFSHLPPDRSIEVFPKPAKVERAETLIGVQKFERMADGSIKLS